MRRIALTAAALLLAAALPALAAGPDPTADSINAAWRRHQEDDGNLRNSLVILMQERAALRERVAALTEKCGAACVEPAPTAKTDPEKPSSVTVPLKTPPKAAKP